MASLSIEHLTNEQLLRSFEKKLLTKTHEHDDCLIWDGSRSGSSPIFSYRPLALHAVNVRRMILSLSDGYYGAGVRFSTTCQTPFCICRKHIVIETTVLLDGTPDERFDASYEVNPVTGCWEWVGSLHKGYGVLIHKDLSMRMRAHRYAYERFVSLIPEGMDVLHRCDNKRCCNPVHLELGTHIENIRQAKDRGLILRGSDSPVSKIDEADALAIYNDSRDRLLIAASYGISRATVRDIKCGRTWSHVTGHKPS